MSPVRTRVLISGRVQGVWFRESTRERAAALGLTGWVRNLHDGRVAGPQGAVGEDGVKGLHPVQAPWGGAHVEALFEGEAAAVEAALDFVREGPPLARVRSAEVVEHEESAPTEVGFRVRMTA